MGKITTIFVILLMITTATIAANIPSFSVDSSKSTLYFEATQNGSPIKGSFSKFDSDIQFSQQFLNDSNAIITVDMASVTSDNTEVIKTLNLPDWFSSSTFPKSIFHSTAWRWKGGKQFEVDGTLAIRDKTVPIMISFVLKEFTTEKAIVEGKTTIKRTDFGVGQGEWKDTHLVKDEVNITFHVEAIPSAMN